MGIADFNSEAVERVKETDKMLKEENSKEVVSKKGEVTRLMFEQMLRGLYLNTI